jgi:hypothetical protein
MCLMKQATEFGVVDARPIPLRSLQQCAGTLPVRPVLDTRLDHLPPGSGRRSPPRAYQWSVFMRVTSANNIRVNTSR